MQKEEKKQDVMKEKDDFRVGTVCIMGKANAGKSSLINALIREKVSIVSPKPQTTRNNIVGIYNDPNSQIVFVDTPGIHISDSKLGEMMNKSVNTASQDVDCVLLLVDGSKPIKQDTFDFINKFKNLEKVILLITKTDLTTFEKLYPSLDELNKISWLKEILPISSHKSRNLDVLIDMIKKYLPKASRQDMLFDAETYTNKSVRFMSAEIIREKILLALQNEVPHGVAINIINWEEGYTLAKIYADIICEKSSHKSIIIGKKGSTLKKIGMQSRMDIEKMLGKQVYLELFVKVKENWKNNPAVLQELSILAQDEFE